MTVEERLNYTFKDKDLLSEALTHRSVVGANNNERLEFLGDALLGYIVAEALFQSHPDAQEGELSRMRASLVCGNHLAEMAVLLDLGKYVRLGFGEKKNRGHHRPSILANTFEALIGAVYLDAGMDTCRHIVMKIYASEIDTLSRVTSEKDAKSVLQEWLQARKHPLPTYAVTTSGEAHAQTFYIVCRVEGLPYEATGTDTSRRKAEQAAAKAYLELLHDKSS